MSCESNLPIPPATPVCTIAKLLHKLSIEKSVEEAEEPTVAINHTTSQESLPNSLSKTLKELNKTSLAYLISNNIPPPNSPLDLRAHSLIAILYHLDGVQPQTVTELGLLASLQEVKAEAEALQQCLISMQAANVLNKMYCRVLRKHLANYDKKKQQAKKSGTLVGDGLPWLLLSDAFYELVCDHEERQRVAEQEKQARKAAREARYKALEIWKKQDKKRKQANKTKTALYQMALKRWQEQKAEARSRGEKFTLKKSVRGPLASPIPKPAAMVMEDDNDNGELGSDSNQSDSE
ncbi:hypothetical protein F5146DRAFT_924617 [Armillaria mellea]|nr:hypothetical protein F5146DRAFT_924617 [Armillaria mellea]